MSSSPTPHDKWTVSEGVDGFYIFSNDFENDAGLKLGGDFVSKDAKKRYAEMIAAKLNAVPSEKTTPSLIGNLVKDFGKDPEFSGFIPGERVQNDPPNHKEAYELACMRQEDSNLARCYLALREELNTAPSAREAILEEAARAVTYLTDKEVSLWGWQRAATNAIRALSDGGADNG